MALKSIVDIDIDDSSFQRYAASFAKYSDTVKEMPEAWSAVAASSAAAAAAGAEMGVSVGAAYLNLHKLASENATITRNTERQAGAWASMAGNAGKFASRVVEATRSLLRWGELTGLISGILGVGGLFGIDRLAISAGNQRKNAMGIGSTPGELNAFETDYTRLLGDPRSFLGGVNEALHDVTKRVGLYAAGMGEDQLRGKDTTQVGAELIPYLKRLIDRTPDSMIGNIPLIKQLGLTLDDIQRIRKTSPEELEQYQQGYQRDARTLNLPDATAKAWQDLQVQFHRAGQTIENVFITGLVNLAGPIDRLSVSFTKFFEDLLKQGGPLSSWIDALGHGIDWLGKEIGKPEFEAGIFGFINGITALAEKIPDFVSNVGEIVDSLASAIKSVKSWDLSLPKLKDYTEAPLTPSEGSGNDEGKSFIQKWEDGVLGWFGVNPAPKGGYLNAPGEYNWKNMFLPGNQPSEAPSTAVQKQAFDRLEGDQGLPPGLLNAVMQTESHGDPNATSSAGAKGYFQFMDPTARTYGVQDPRDFGQSATGASRYFHKLLDEFHGDLAKALAGYNWGEDKVEKDVSEHGNAWLNYAPRETQDYVGKVTGGMRSAPGAESGGNYADLIQEFHGDLAKIAAASRIGAAAVEKDVKDYGAEWRSHLPEDTQKYVSSVVDPHKPKPKFVPNNGAPSGMALNIYNYTGGNAYIAASQIATA